jgi:hypothetical protein
MIAFSHMAASTRSRMNPGMYAKSDPATRGRRDGDALPLRVLTAAAPQDGVVFWGPRRKVKSAAR